MNGVVICGHENYKGKMLPLLSLYFFNLLNGLKCVDPSTSRSHTKVH